MCFEGKTEREERIQIAGFRCWPGAAGEWAAIRHVLGDPRQFEASLSNQQQDALRFASALDEGFGGAAAGEGGLGRQLLVHAQLATLCAGAFATALPSSLPPRAHFLTCLVLSSRHSGGDVWAISTMWCAGRAGGGLVGQGEAVLAMARHSAGGQPLRWADEHAAEELYVQLLRLTARAADGGDVRTAERLIGEAAAVDGLLPSIRCAPPGTPNQHISPGVLYELVC